MKNCPHKNMVSWSPSLTFRDQNHPDYRFFSPASLSTSSDYGQNSDYGSRLRIQNTDPKFGSGLWPVITIELARGPLRNVKRLTLYWVNVSAKTKRGGIIYKYLAVFDSNYVYRRGFWIQLFLIKTTNKLDLHAIRL